MSLTLLAFTTGLVISVSIGPIFFLLIETAAKGKIGEAYRIAIGTMLSDLLVIGFAYLIVKEIFVFSDELKQLLSVISGCTLLIIGIASLIRRIKNKTIPSYGKSPFFHAFFINIINPSTIIIWTVVCSRLINFYELGTPQIIHSIAIILGTMALLDVVKIHLSGMLSTFVQEGKIRFIGMITGVLLILGGCKIIWDAIL